MPIDGFGTDAFQWKNSSHKQASLGFGLSNSNTDDDTNRQTDTARDTVRDTARDIVTELFRPDRLTDLEDIVTDYYSHFNTGITFDNRAYIRAKANEVWNYAKDELYDKIQDTVEDQLAEEDRRLEKELCASVARMNSIAGSTRNCFTQHVIAETLSDHAIKRAALVAEVTSTATQLESQAIQAAQDDLYQAYIEADHLDFQKYLGVLQVLRGAYAVEDLDEIVDEDMDEGITDVINRDINTLKLTAQYSRTAGAIADASGTYVDEYDAVVAAGGAAIP